MTIFTLQLLYLPLASSSCSSSVLPGFAGPTHTLKCGSAPTDSRVWLCAVFVFVSLFIRVKLKCLTYEKVILRHSLKVAFPFLGLSEIEDSEISISSVIVKLISVKSEVRTTCRHTVSRPLKLHFILHPNF